MFVPVSIAFGAILAAIFLALFIYSIVWAYHDAEARGKSPILVALIVALIQWPAGLILWLVFRPDSR
ncbi:MAG: hypothetical protein NTZ09_15295 [Candidatus Hydrogenedentes bacterium]|nr:hypothetical protein [Candidatus Hydrogenedentota bacterium]